MPASRLPAFLRPDTLDSRRGRAPPASGATRPGAVGRNLLLSSFGMLLPVLASLVALPLMVQGFGSDRFGVFSLLLGIFAYVSLLDLGLGTAVSYRVAHMIHEAAEPHRVRGTVRTAATVTLIAGMLVAVVLGLAAEWLCARILGAQSAHLAEATACLRLLAASLPAVYVAAVFSGVLIAHEAFDRLNRTRVPFGVLLAITPALVATSHLSLVLAAAALLALRLAAVAVQGGQCARLLPGLWRRAPGEPATKDLSALLRFGGWTTVSSVVGPLMVYMDRFYLAAANSPGVVAEYVATYEVASKLLLLPALFMPVFFPVLIGTRVRNAAESELLLARVATGGALLCSIPAAVAAASAPELLGRLLPAIANPRTAAALQMLCGGALVSCVAQVFFLQVQTLGRTRAIATAHLVQVPCYLLLLWWATAHYGLIGVALAWALRMVADAVLFCGMAAARLHRETRVRLWRTFALTFGYALVLAGLSLVQSLLLRTLALALPVGILLVLRKELTAIARGTLLPAFRERREGA